MRGTDPIRQSKIPTDGKQGSKNRHFAKDSDLCKWDLKQTLLSDCQRHTMSQITALPHNFAKHNYSSFRVSKNKKFTMMVEFSLICKHE